MSQQSSDDQDDERFMIEDETITNSSGTGNKRSKSKPCVVSIDLFGLITL